jgi:hypothetical protein
VKRRAPITEWFWEWYGNPSVKAALEDRLLFLNVVNTRGLRESLELAYRAGFRDGRNADAVLEEIAGE